ncbi:O-antigen/teichoic acid export membrane protein [Microbacterium keratanolyticum]|uniref:O-antigen/teichoic acid export membrane protein n=1 Tax=Microbacterium keratanolyticum TaxID=67574 RepID=A0A9W6M8X7_9MICO|nr:oligosaccharide flippase family protein [Microbacterium keratanolyticum]MBM7469475.1 O-antigen/teichoic acid export membrane protein [Microbacterium keratanolyticum]GLK01554.1 hypothetical protein GCM10017596_12690 [Microbacterium keratanolyticum]
MKNRIVRGMLALVSGALLGQLILVLATPLLARIYDPAAFGAFSALVAVSSILGPVAALKFDAGIVLPESEDKARGLLRLALWSSLGISVLSGLLVGGLSLTPFGQAWALVPGAPLWAGALVLATSVFTVLAQAALRRQRYGVVATRAPFQSAGTVVGQVGLGLVGAGATGLVGGFLVGRLFGFLPLYRTARPLLARPQTGDYRSLIREYRRLPLILSSAALVNALGAQLPLLLIAGQFGQSDAGQFGMAQRLIAVPATLLGASVAQLFGAELAALVRNGLLGARRMYLQTTLRLGAVAVAVALAIVFLSPPVLPFVLGEGWEATVPIAQALAVYAAASLVGSPLSQVYTIYQSRATIVVDALRVAFVGAAWMLVLAQGWGMIPAVWALSIAQTAGYVVLWGYGLRLVVRHEGRGSTAGGRSAEPSEA